MVSVTPAARWSNAAFVGSTVSVDPDRLTPAGGVLDETPPSTRYITFETDSVPPSGSEAPISRLSVNAGSPSNLDALSAFDTIGVWFVPGSTSTGAICSIALLL